MENNSQLNSRTYLLMCTSKATPVSRSRGWCSMRTMVSMKVTLIRRRTANTDEMGGVKGLISTDLSNHFFSAVCVQTGLFTGEGSLLLWGHGDFFTKWGHTQLWRTCLNGLCKHLKPFQLGRRLLGRLRGVLQALLSQLHAGGHAWWPALGVPTPTWVQTTKPHAVQWFLYFRATV